MGPGHSERGGAGPLDFLNEAQRALVEPLLEPVRLGRGEDLYRIGEAAGCAYLIVSGTLAVRQLNTFGDRGQAIALLSAGAPVGEAALAGLETRGSTLTAVEDTALLKLSRERFSRLRGAHPEVAAALLEFFLSRASLRLRGCSARLSRIL